MVDKLRVWGAEFWPVTALNARLEGLGTITPVLPPPETFNTTVTGNVPPPQPIMTCPV